MNQSTTQQSQRRFRPVKLPESAAKQTQVQQGPRNQQYTSQVGVKWMAQAGEGETNRIYRADTSSKPQPSLAAEKRLDKYVGHYRTTPKTAKQLGISQVSLPQENVGQSHQLSPNARRKPVLDFVTKPITELDTPGPQNANSASQESGMPRQADAMPTFRVDAPQQVGSRPHLDFPIVSNFDQRAREQAAPVLAQSENVSDSHEREILADPNTCEIVASVASAIASVIKDQPQEDLLPEAKNLFESSLKQHAIMLDRQESQEQQSSEDAAISEAMLSSIAQQRQVEAFEKSPITETTSPVKLASELKERIAQQQRAIVQSQINEQNQARAEITEATNRAERPMPQSETPSTASGEADRLPSVKFKQTHEASIPMDAAAWDVEDFRWPAITNQMIVTGGPAIEQLLAFATSRTSAHPKRIVISSAGRAQGTTTIAITMARIAVAAGMKTLLVDADVASPDLSQRVGLSANMSWLNGINKDLPVSELIVRSKASNLCLMPLSSTVTRVTWPRFIFDNLGGLVSQGLPHFDLVIFDTGPVSQLLDELSRPEILLDGVVLVDSNSKSKELQVYQNRLTTFGVDNLVLAENRKTTASSNVA